tara:strand:- start:404 stop:655 length:252 start_codon:yes stop_codon:yes gene_type:complete
MNDASISTGNRLKDQQIPRGNKKKYCGIVVFYRPLTGRCIILHEMMPSTADRLMILLQQNDASSTTHRVSFQMKHMLVNDSFD